MSRSLSNTACSIGLKVVSIQAELANAVTIMSYLSQQGCKLSSPPPRRRNLTGQNRSRYPGLFVCQALRCFGHRPHRLTFNIATQLPHQISKAALS